MSPSTPTFVPRQLFGSKLGLEMGSAGKDKIRYVIIYRVKPVKEMMVRYGTCHKNCAKKHIRQDDTIILIQVECGLFGLDTSGQLRKGSVEKFSVPKGVNLKFDGFRGIELDPTVNGTKRRNKYRVWKPNVQDMSWELAPSTTVDVLDKDGKTVTKVKENLHSYYAYQESLLPLPETVLHDDGLVLIPATEAVDWMKEWVRRAQGMKTKVMEAPALTQDNMGKPSVDR